MTHRRRKLAILAVLLVWANLVIAARALPRDSKRSQPSGVIIQEAGARKSSSGAVGNAASRNPPTSPVKLFMPDEFQFYTLNNNGQLVRKQMTKQQIQGMIANGGPGTGMPVDLGLHHHHHHHELGPEPKVSDIVQNVQKILKDELSKPIKIQSSASSIPGSVNSQWTNMLPYILSGGSADQQYSQDSSIVLPGTDNDQSYVDVVPLESARPADNQYEPRPSYVPDQLVYDEKENKLVSRRPVYDNTQKPISLLGNMQLDQDILEGQNTYTPPTKAKPSKTTRPTTTTVSYRITMTKPTPGFNWKDDGANKNDSSEGKPTLYIPLSVSSSLLTNSQNKENFDLDFQMLSGLKPRPSYSDMINTQLPHYGAGSTMTTRFPTRTTTKSYDDSQKPTRLSVPSIPTERISTSTTPRADQQKATTSSTPSTASQEITMDTTDQDNSDSIKIINPQYSPDKSDTDKKPVISHRPVFVEQNSPSSVNLDVPSSERPMVGSTLKSNTGQTHHSIYQPQTQSTKDILSSTYRPVYQPPSTIGTHQPIHTPESEVSDALLEVTPSLYPVYQGLPTHDADIETYTRERDSTPSTPAFVPVKTENEQIQTTKSPQVSTTSTTERIQEIFKDNEELGTVLSAEVQEKLPSDSVSSPSVLKNDLHTTKPVVQEEGKNSTNNYDTLTSSTIMNAESIRLSTQSTTVPGEIEDNSHRIESTTLQTDTENILSTVEDYKTEIPQRVQTENHAQSYNTGLYTLSEQEAIKDIHFVLKSTVNTPIEFSEITTPQLEAVETVKPIKLNPSQDDEVGEDEDTQNPTQPWINNETTQSIPLSEILAENDLTLATDSETSPTIVKAPNNETESEILALSQKKIIASFADLKDGGESDLRDPELPVTSNEQDELKHPTDNYVMSKEGIKSEAYDEIEQSKTETSASIPITESGLFVDKVDNNNPTEGSTEVEQNSANHATQDHVSGSTDNQPTNMGIRATEVPMPQYFTPSAAKNPLTESESSTNKAELIPPESFKEERDEVSTVKVIPIYDDGTPVYSLPSENTHKAPLLEQTTLKSETNHPKETKTSPSSTPTKTTLYIKPFKKEDEHSVMTTQASSISESPLPGLGEALDSYMKEYSVSKMPTDTFPTVIYKGSLNDNGLFGGQEDLLSTDSFLITKGPFSNSDSPYVDHKYDEGGSLNYESKSSQNVDDIVSLEEEPTLISTIDSIVPEIPTSTVVPYSENSDAPSLGSDSNGDSKVETPIIYLDLTSPNPIEKVKTQKLSQDSLANSSLTRIKTKLPIEDIDELLAQTVPLQEQDIPSTVSYTLPSEYKPPNQIASGIIAGYPTYDGYDSSSASSLAPNSTNVTAASKLENPVSEMQFTTSETKTPGKNVTENESKSPQISVEDSKKTITEVTSSSHEETSTKNDSEIINDETHMQTSPYSSPTDSGKQETIKSSTEQVNTSINVPLDKISNIINQLENSPTEFDKGSYDSFSGVQTTILPTAGFESVMKDHNPTTEYDSLTTIVENLGRTSDDTFVEEQTSNSNNTGEVFTTSVRPINPIPTVRGITKTKSTIRTETISSSTPMTRTRPSVSRRPLLASATSTTKGSMEKVQSTIDKSAGRIHLDDEKIPHMKPTEPTKFSMKTRAPYTTTRRPTVDGQKISQAYIRRPSRPVHRGTPAVPSTKITVTENPSVNILATQRTTVEPMANSKDNVTERLTTVQPQKNGDEPTEEVKKQPTNVKEDFQELSSEPVKLEHSTGAVGLDQSSAGQDKDVTEFLNMCNELSSKFWSFTNAGLSSARSVTLSPFGMISTLAMIFLGARGLTSNQMNDVLKLDDVVTFNPHLVFQNITDTVTLARGQGIENAAFVRALFADRLKVRRIIPFYKEQAQQFYEGAVVDINFSTAGDILRRRTNLLIRKQTGGKIKDFMKTHTISLHSPLTALSANVFQSSCDGSESSIEGRDGEMYFAVAETVKQRKLVPIPAVLWKSGVSAGYEPSLDATAVALGDAKRPVSMIMVMPGQQGATAPGDNLERLETRLFSNPGENLNKLLKVIVPRKLEVQVPKFCHRSIVNVTAALKRMGFEQLFTRNADLKGINGAGHDLFLADMVQMNLFCTCADDNKAGGRHLSETYPGTSSRQTRSWELSNSDSYKITNNNNSSNINGVNEHVDKGNSMTSRPTKDSSCEDGDETGVPMNLRQNSNRNRLRWLSPTKRRLCRHRRQAESEKSRMRMDKPFLYFVRHNLTGLILHIGRFNPKNQS